MKAYAGIYMLDIPYSVDREFDYFIPLHLRDQIGVGDFAAVPFGTNRTKIGVITRISDKPQAELTEYKPILSLGDKRLSMNKEALGIAFFLKEQTLCTLGEAVRSMVPTFVLSRLAETYRISGDAPPGTEPHALLVYDFIKKKPGVASEALRSKFGSGVQTHLKALASCGAVARAKGGTTSEKFENLYSLATRRS